MPSLGRRLPAPAWLLAKASPNEASMPMTSPVERISGPSSVSLSGKRLKGSTASFTATWPPLAGSPSSPSARSSASVAPSITRAATLASGTPVALAMKGTVRDARGFTSSTETAPSFTAYWTLISPSTPSASAKRRVWASMVAITSRASVGGGMAQALSPLWTPASSMCSRTPPITTSPVRSRMASTSTSVASSRKRSIRAGRDADRPPSRPSEPLSPSSFMAAARPSSSSTMRMARPPSTYEGRTRTG